MTPPDAIATARGGSLWILFRGRWQQEADGGIQQDDPHQHLEHLGWQVEIASNKRQRDG